MRVRHRCMLLNCDRTQTHKPPGRAFARRDNDDGLPNMKAPRLPGGRRRGAFLENRRAGGWVAGLVSKNEAATGAFRVVRQKIRGPEPDRADAASCARTSASRSDRKRLSRVKCVYQEAYI